MDTSRKAMKWLICFSIVNLILRCLLFKKLKKKLMNLVHRQKQPECHQHILNKGYIIKAVRFVKTQEDISKDRS